MKTILYMAVSIDGKTTFDVDDVSWVSEEDIARFDELMVECGVMLMGSNTFGSFGEDLPNDKALQVVVTNDKELLNKPVNNVLFTNQAPEEVLSKLEADGFSEVMVAGGSKLNTSLFKLDLIDEIRLIVKPVLLGTGKPLCSELGEIKNFRLVSSKVLKYGAVELRFARSN